VLQIDKMARSVGRTYKHYNDRIRNKPRHSILPALGCWIGSASEHKAYTHYISSHKTRDVYSAVCVVIKTWVSYG
jgi:hypothetical protein